MTFNYKKNKLEQLKGFCTTVECGNSVNDAAIKNCISATTISKQISSLETDLGFQLFDRVKNRLVLNEKGKAYYQETKRILLDLDRVYDGKIGIRKIDNIEIFFRRIKVQLESLSAIFKLKLKKRFINLTFRGFLIFILIIFISIVAYMTKTNHFFDKELEKLANPLLKEIIQKDYHRIDKNTFCSFEPTQFHLDINKLLLELLEKKYDIRITCLTVNEHPGTPMRMNGDEKIDSVFHNSDAIKCDTERRYISLKTRHQEKIAMMEASKNTHLYNFYAKEDGRNHNIFLENLAKYPNQLFGIKTDLSHFPLNTGKYWIIKYDNYYYLFLESNGIQSQHQDTMQERYLIYKKLTLNELMHYDNGSYWKVIKEYNVMID